MVIVYVEVPFRLQREGHAAVLCEGVVHLCIPMDHVDLSECTIGYKCEVRWRTYVVEETNPGRDFDDLLRR